MCLILFHVFLFGGIRMTITLLRFQSKKKSISNLNIAVKGFANKNNTKQVKEVFE